VVGCRQISDWNLTWLPPGHCSTRLRYANAASWKQTKILLDDANPQMYKHGTQRASIENFLVAAQQQEHIDLQWSFQNFFYSKPNHKRLQPHLHLNNSHITTGSDTPCENLNELRLHSFISYHFRILFYFKIFSAGSRSWCWKIAVDPFRP
jgi:hypothetical protein